MGRVDLHVGNTMLALGQDDFVHSFFSTVAYQLEKEGWGSRFPALMKELFRGRLPKDHVPQARVELEQVRDELSRLPPEARVYTYDDPNRPTPWPIPPGASSLADCFLSVNGKNVLDLVERALDLSERTGADVEIRSFDGAGTHTYLVGDER
jgi:hypothetical protein